MNLRHAAALALVGWYFMAPPFDSARNVVANAPLAQWQIIASFDSASACQSAKFEVTQREQAEPERLLKSAPSTVTDADLQKFIQADSTANRAIASVCISTDDPRLAK